LRPRGKHRPGAGRANYGSTEGDQTSNSPVSVHGAADESVWNPDGQIFGTICVLDDKRNDVLPFRSDLRGYLHGRERLGIDRSYLAEVETGKIEICLRNLALIAQAFGLETWEPLKF